jgi:hypothetical protein
MWQARVWIGNLSYDLKAVIHRKPYSFVMHPVRQLFNIDAFSTTIAGLFGSPHGQLGQLVDIEWSVSLRQLLAFTDKESATSEVK